MMIESGNDYLGALRGNHSHFHEQIQKTFKSESHIHTVETGHGRVDNPGRASFESRVIATR